MEKYEVEIREFERGWGSKVEEIKSFSTKEEADEFTKEYNKNNKCATVPDWYMVAIKLYYDENHL